MIGRARIAIADGLNQKQTVYHVTFNEVIVGVDMYCVVPFNEYAEDQSQNLSAVNVGAPVSVRFLPLPLVSLALPRKSYRASNPTELAPNGIYSIAGNPHLVALYVALVVGAQRVVAYLLIISLLVG